MWLGIIQSAEGCLEQNVEGGKICLFFLPHSLSCDISSPASVWNHIVIYSGLSPSSVLFSSVQSLSHVWLYLDWNIRPASLVLHDAGGILLYFSVSISRKPISHNKSPKYTKYTATHILLVQVQWKTLTLGLSPKHSNSFLEWNQEKVFFKEHPKWWSG